MAGILYEFAVPISTGLGSSEAAESVRIMSLVMVLWGLVAVPTAQCIRDFRQDTIFLANTLSFFPSTALLLILAKHGNGATAFAWSRLAAQATSSVVVLLRVPKLHLPGMTRDALSVLFRVGLPLAFANFIGYILQNVDYALIGRLIGPVELGAYVIAFNAASWASTLLGSVLNSVSMPAFSRVKHDAVRLKAAMADGIRVVMLIAAPMCMLVAVLARPIVLTLYGARWASAATVLSILSAYGLISVVGILFAGMLAALGYSKYVLIIQVIWLIGLVPAMATGVHKDGIVGAAIAHIAIVVPVVLPCYLIALKRATGIELSMLAKAALPSFTLAAAAAGLAWYAASMFSSPAIQLMAGLMAGGSFYAIMTVPQLIPLAMRGRAIPPKMRRILITYYRIGRTLWLPIGPPPRHAVRRRYRTVVRSDRPRNLRTSESYLVTQQRLGR